MRFCIGISPQFGSHGELHHLCSLRVRPGRVRWLFQCPAREQILTDPIRRFRSSCGFHHRVWIASSWSATANPIFSVHVRQFRGERPLPSFIRPAIPRHAPVAISIRVWQFRGTRSLSSASRPAILGHAPIVVSFTSGNLGARAHCHQLHVWQFQGERPLSSVFTSGNSGASVRCR